MMRVIGRRGLRAGCAALCGTPAGRASSARPGQIALSPGAAARAAAAALGRVKPSLSLVASDRPPRAEGAGLDGFVPLLARRLAAARCSTPPEGLLAALVSAVATLVLIVGFAPRLPLARAPAGRRRAGDGAPATS